MMKYEIEDRKFGGTWIKVVGQNSKKETMTIEIVHCTNPGGNNSLPYLWHKAGLTDKVMETYLCCHTYVDDSEGNCYGRYNPTEKISDDGKRNVINFEWLFEDTEENMLKIINECIRLFESAKGKSATELKIEHVMEVAKKRGIEVVFELPDGWSEKHCYTDPIGATTIENGKRLFKNENGKLQVNPDYKQMLMIV